MKQGRCRGAKQFAPFREHQCKKLRIIPRHPDTWVHVVTVEEKHSLSMYWNEKLFCFFPNHYICPADPQGDKVLALFWVTLSNKPFGTETTWTCRVVREKLQLSCCFWAFSRIAAEYKILVNDKSSICILCIFWGHLLFFSCCSA